MVRAFALMRVNFLTQRFGMDIAACNNYAIEYNPSGENPNIGNRFCVKHIYVCARVNLMEANELRERYNNLQLSEAKASMADLLRKNFGSVMIRVSNSHGNTIECQEISYEMAAKIAGMFDEIANDYLEKALGETPK